MKNRWPHPGGMVAILFAFLFLVVPAWATAAPAGAPYRTQLGRDLDGDHIPETATIRQHGFVYKVNIHFSSGRPRLRLTVYYAEDAAGLSFQTSDLDNDRDEDLVITSATSLRPLAVWLNRGKAKFQKVSSWEYGGPVKHNGPDLRRSNAYRPEAPVSSSNDPLPDETTVAEVFVPGLDLEKLSSFQPEQLPSKPTLRQLPARGPPLTPRTEA